MSWKHVLYALFVVVVAGASALAGVVAGGIAVYQAVVRVNQAAWILPYSQRIQR